jgi:hypothetical protein
VLTATVALQVGSIGRTGMPRRGTDTADSDARLALLIVTPLVTYR